MININSWRTILLLLLLAGLSCTKKGNTGPTGPAGPPGPTATSNPSQLYGHVSLYDQYGARTVSQLSSVQLVLKGGTYTFADSSGYYVFPQLVSGNYTLTATATGYGGTVVGNINLSGDTLYRDIRLSKKPDFDVQAFTVSKASLGTYDACTLTFSSDSRPRNCIVFVGRTRSVSGQPGHYVLAYTKTINPYITAPIIQVPVNDLNGVNIYYGEEVYFAACSYVVNDASVYEDYTTGSNVYNAVGTALIDSALCP